MKTYYIHIIIIFILFAHFKSSNGQSIPQMRLKTSEFKPSTFTPSQYKPIQSDPSILQRSFERQEQRANQANQALLDLINICSQLKSQMPPSELEWYNNFADSICDYVENQIQIGNTQTAYRIAMENKSGIRNNPNVRYRIDSYKQYCDDMQNHGLYNYQNGRVTQTTYEWYCITNPYKFIPKYDISGNLIGYKPVHVAYLYPSINWQEVNQYFTNQSCTREDVERLWTLYFSYDPDKLSSLSQEFNVAKFCLDYFTANYNNPNMSQAEKQSLQNNINAYRAILTDADGEISYDAFVENLKKQYVVNPPVTKKKSNTRKQTQKRRNARPTRK